MAAEAAAQRARMEAAAAAAAAAAATAGGGVEVARLRHELETLRAVHAAVEAEWRAQSAAAADRGVIMEAEVRAPCFGSELLGATPHPDPQTSPLMRRERACVSKFHAAVGRLEGLIGLQ
jgi:hypothetical protein